MSYGTAIDTWRSLKATATTCRRAQVGHVAPPKLSVRIDDPDHDSRALVCDEGEHLNGLRFLQEICYEKPEPCPEHEVIFVIQTNQSIFVELTGMQTCGAS